MFINRLNITPVLLLDQSIHPKRLIPLLNQLRQPTRHRSPHSLLTRETPHQLRRAHGHYIAAINLPEMIRLAVHRRDVSHLRRLGRLPDRVRDAARRRHNQHPGFHFEFVRVPQFSLFGWEGLEEARGDHVFDTD